MIKIEDSKRDKILNDFIPDLTPLLDIVFILILFLILSSNNLPYKIDLDIPQDKEGIAEQNKENNFLIVKILANNQGWLVEDKKFDNFADFKKNLLENYHDKETKITIMSDAQVKVQKFVDLLLFLQKHQIQTADILVKQ